MHYYANKGLFIKHISDGIYTIEDVFGTCLLPFQSTEEELDTVTEEIANVKKLVTIGISSEFPDLSDFKWNELEFFYIAHIDYAFLASLVGEKEREHYQSILGLFPIGYLDCGYGDGSKDVLEFIHRKFQESCEDEGFPIQEKDLALFLTTNQVKRICNDIMSLMNRSISSFADLLRCQRTCIAKSHKAIDQLDSKEIIHHGHDSYQAASAVTSLVISLCSSLDLSAKLIQFINAVDGTNLVYKPARDKQYHEVRKIKPKMLNEKVLDDIRRLQASNREIPEIIQFRNDLIHSTSALELEKIYVGIETNEINELPLYYSAQYARDCLDSGQPVRFLGRDYFVENKQDIEMKTLSWINCVFEYHLKIGEYIYKHLQGAKKA